MAYDDRDDELDDLDVRRHRRGPNEPIPNYLAQSILVTLCCCLPFGIVAIINAVKVNGFVAQEEYDLALKASEDAKKWCGLAFVLGLIANVIAGAFQIFAR